MIDDAGRNGIEVDVGHLIGAYNHGYILLVESIDHRLQGVLVFVHVIAVKLHDELSSVLAVSGQVPIATDAHVIIVSDDMDQARVIIFSDSFTGAVGGEIVHHHQVKLEVTLLFENRINGIADGANAVAHGNHHSGLDLKLALVELDVAEVRHLLTVFLAYG